MKISKSAAIAGTALFVSLSGAGLAAQSATAPPPAIHRAEGNVPPGATRAVVASCGRKAIAGGGYAVPEHGEVLVSRPESTTLHGRHPTKSFSWRVLVHNPTKLSMIIRAYSVCST